MRAVVVGLGSMGRRRIRNLAALGIDNVIGVDPRLDRRESASRDYGIPSTEQLRGALLGSRPDIALVCTEPSAHMEVAEQTVELGIDTFIEASVIEPERISRLARTATKKNLIVAPSCTMRFFPGPTLLRDLLKSDAIGRPLIIRYHVGQWLEDWHPWEPVSEYYVSRRETGGCREIVPFELTWLVEFLGVPEILSAWKGKLSGIDADIDDCYTFDLRFPEGTLASIMIDVLSRPLPTRTLRAIGSAGIVDLDSELKRLRYKSITDDDWQVLEWEEGFVEEGYSNPERPYIKEMTAFLQAVSSRDPDMFPNSLARDRVILDLLGEIERTCRK